jgi:hypothetical protein
MTAIQSLHWPECPKSSHTPAKIMPFQKLKTRSAVRRPTHAHT